MRTTRHQLIAVLFLVACGKPGPQPGPEVRQEPGYDYFFTGLTVVPGTGQRWWLKPGVGLVDSDQKTVFQDPTPYDDVVALDSDRIALIMRNDGFVYRVSTHQLLNRFCYLPDDVSQRMPTAFQQSFVVGWDAAEERLYVQPQTLMGGERVVDAQLGVFRADLATPLEWQTVPGAPDMQAGGIAVLSREHIWLGWGSALYHYDAKAQQLEKRLALDVRDISALAVEGDRLLVLDGSAGKLLSLPLDGLN